MSPKGYEHNERAYDLTQAYSFLSRAAHWHQLLSRSLGVDLLIFVAFGMRRAEEHWSSAILLAALILVALLGQWLGGWLLTGLIELRKLGSNRASRKTSQIWALVFVALGIFAEIAPRLPALGWWGLAALVIIIAAVSPWVLRYIRKAFKQIASDVEVRHAQLHDANEVITLSHLMSMGAARAVSLVGLFLGGSNTTFLAYFCLSAGLLAFLKPAHSLFSRRCKNCARITARTVLRKGLCPPCAAERDRFEKTRAIPERNVAKKALRNPLKR